MKKALVLGGGGSKGAYEIGVWKALDELDQHFDIVCGTTPQAWHRIMAAGRGDLTLSGHVHSLQMKLRLGQKWQWSPAAWFYDEWSGPYADGERMLYVNDGIGYAMVPMRIGARPEITLFELRRSDGGDCIGGGIE